MKTLTCELCGSTSLVKQNGVFICQSCGMKYTVEEAKKLMVESKTEILETTENDNSEAVDTDLQVADDVHPEVNYGNADLDIPQEESILQPVSQRSLIIDQPQQEAIEDSKEETINNPIPQSTPITERPQQETIKEEEKVEEPIAQPIPQSTTVIEQPQQNTLVEDEEDVGNSNRKFIVIAVIAACIGCFFWWYNSSQKEKPDMEVVSDTIESDTIATEEIEEDYGTFPTNPEAFIGDGQCFDLRGHAMCTDGMDLILGPDGRIMVKPQEEEDSLSTPDELTDIKRNVKGKLMSFAFKNSGYWYSGDFVYNKDGLVERIQIDYVRSGDKTVFTYNEQGYIIHAAYSDYGISMGDGEVVETKSQYKYKYKEFDSHGNWIQRICIDEKGKESVETRDITYY